MDWMNSGDKKAMMSWFSWSGVFCCCCSLYFPNWLTGMMLKATRPREVIWRLCADTSGRMRLVEGVSVGEKDERERGRLN